MTVADAPTLPRKTDLISWGTQEKLKQGAPTGRLLRLVNVGLFGGRANRLELWYDDPEYGQERMFILFVEPCQHKYDPPSMEFEMDAATVSKYVSGTTKNPRFENWSQGKPKPPKPKSKK